MTRTFGFAEAPRASAGMARARASEPKNARRIGPFTVVRIVSASLAVTKNVCHSRLGEAVLSRRCPRSRRARQGSRGGPFAGLRRPPRRRADRSQALPARRPALARQRQGALPDAVGGGSLEQLAPGRSRRGRPARPRYGRPAAARLAARRALLDRRRRPRAVPDGGPCPCGARLLRPRPGPRPFFPAAR